MIVASSDSVIGQHLLNFRFPPIAVISGLRLSAVLRFSVDANCGLAPEVVRTEQMPLPQWQRGAAPVARADLVFLLPSLRIADVLRAKCALPLFRSCTKCDPMASCSGNGTKVAGI